MGNWVQVFTHDFSADSDGAALPAGLSERISGTAEYAISGGRLRRTARGKGANNCLILAGETAVRHKVRVVCSVALTAGGNNPPNGVFAADHYPTDLSGTFAGYGGLFDASNGVIAPELQNGQIDGGTLYTRSQQIFPAQAEYDFTFFNNNDVCTDWSTVCGSYSANATNTYQPNSFTTPGFGIVGSDASITTHAIKSVTISKWDSNAVVVSPLTLTTAAGHASVAGNVLTVAAPTVSGGQGTISWVWKYYSSLTDYVGSTIASGTGTPQALNYTVPSGRQNAKGFVACTLTDGTTTFTAVGYDAASIGEATTGLYVPFFAPAPTVPNDAQITTLAAAITVQGGQKATIGLLGDSITYGLGARMQTILDAVAPNKFTVVNAGHSGSDINSWKRTADLNVGTGMSILDSTKNNFNGLMDVLRAASGPKIVASFLGSNQGGVAADYSSVLDDVQSAAYGVPNVPVVIQEVLYANGYTNSNNVDFFNRNTLVVDPTINPTALRFTAGTDTQAYFLNNLDLFQDVLHPTSAGYDAMARLRLTTILQVLAGAAPVVVPPTPTTGHDPDGDDSTDTSLRLFKRVFKRTVTKQYVCVYQRELPS